MVTVLVMCDWENGIFGAVPSDEAQKARGNAMRLLDAARRSSSGVKIVHVCVRFRPGYPEMASRNKFFQPFCVGEALTLEHESAAFINGLEPAAGEPVVVKRRVGAFFHTELESICRALEVQHVILSGIFTSGVILSTTRWASDADYRITVVEDACADPDSEVHRILCAKVLTTQADVLSTEQVCQTI